MNMQIRATEVAAALEGTCKSLHDVASEEEIDDPIFTSTLDEIVFVCDACGWWFPMDEEAAGGDGFKCQGCVEDDP